MHPDFLPDSGSVGRSGPIDDAGDPGRPSPDTEGGNEPRRSFLRSTLITAAGVPAALLAGSTVGEARTDGEALSRGSHGRGRGRGPGPNVLPTLFPGWTARNFDALRRHENNHRDLLIQTIPTLGGTPRPKPTFRNLAQPNAQAFARTTQALENTGVGAYLGAAPLIESPVVLGIAARIALQEGRHAGWVNSLLNDPITQDVFGVEQNVLDTALTPQQVVELAGPFIADLNGGPPVLQLNNDVDILNFALLLEYLEAEFFNINVPRFLRV